MNCPYCGSDTTEVYYKANMPYILSACDKNLCLETTQKQFTASICKECLLGFNSSKLTDEELRMIYDHYYYISPMNGIGITKYDGMINTLIEYFSVNDKIMEIGCSEGFLLKILKENEYKNLIGIEPGPQAEQAKKLDIDIIKAYFDEDTIKIKQDGFYLMHVFEHFNNPFNIIKCMNNLLNENGKIIIEVPNFTGYHHQHLFYYNLYFMDKLCQDNFLKIIDYSLQNDALRVVIVKNNNLKYNKIDYEFDKTKFIDNMVGYYDEFNKNVKILNDVLSINKNVYWWGAGSSAVIYMNQIDKQQVNKIIVIDGDKNKENLYIPGVNCKVNSFKIIANQSIDTLIIASSFYKEIKGTMKMYNIIAKNIKIIY